MKRSSKVFLTCALVFAFGIPALGLAQQGQMLDLVVKPDTPVGGGDLVKGVVTDGRFEDHAALFMGTMLGQYPIGRIFLGVIPEKIQYLGQFPLTGRIDFGFKLPAQLPPSLSGVTVYMQVASVGEHHQGGGGHHHQYMWHKSNLDRVVFK